MPAVRKSPVVKSRSVLIVESSRAHAGMLAAHCRELEMTPVVCEVAGQALAMAASLPDVAGIVIGAAVDGEGIELIQGLRMLPSLASTPILFVVADDGTAQVRAALVAGATEVCGMAAQHCLENALSAMAAGLGAPSQGGRALIIEDDTFFARLIAVVCGKLGIAVDLASSVEQAFDLFQKHRYQAVVSDVLLIGRETGIDLVRRIRQLPDERARVPILVISNYNDTARRLEVLRCGADGYLSKPFLAEELFWRLRNLLERAGAPLAADQAAPANDDAPPDAAAPGTLSERETEIARAVAQGLSDKKIAEQFGISFWTVRSHINRIFSKLGLANRAGLVKYMMQRQLADAARKGAVPLPGKLPGEWP